MRLFTGLDVPYEMRRNLELLLQLLKPKARISWSHLDNLHVTTMFIGEWPDDRLDELKAALATVPKPGSLKIAIRGLGWFPNPHHPRVFFAGISAPPALEALAGATENAVARTETRRESDGSATGNPPEIDENPSGTTTGPATGKRAYSPHLTLARIREPQPLFDLKKAIADLPSVDFGAFTATAFHLYKSERRPSGSLYTKLATYSLDS